MDLSIITIGTCRTLQRVFEKSFACLRHFLPDQFGITSVQFAMVLPALFATILGTVDMGRMLMAQNTLVHVANEATRFAMVRSTSSDHAASEDDIVSLIKGRMVGLDGELAVVSVNWIPENQPGGRVTVNVDYPYSLLALGMGTVNLNGSSSAFITH